jgi:hypothetical protein
MNNLIEAVSDFYKSSHEQRFIEEQKKVTSAINSVLSKIYLNDGDEIDLVKGTINALNRTPGHRFKMESVFIHGNKSQIKFDYYGKIATKELGDLIFVSTMTYHSKPIIQKMTIVQAKKDRRKKNSSWGLDNEQLHFLTTWPPFEGVKGIFPKRQNIVIDNSGCLGSYLLYREPGEFVFIAAPTLGRFLGNKKSVKISELAAIQDTSLNSKNQQNFFNQTLFPFPMMHPKEWYYYWEEIVHHYYKKGIPFPFTSMGLNDSILGNQHIALNVNDTVNHLSLLNIGELIFSEYKHAEVNENAYRLLNTVVRYISQQQIDKVNDLNLHKYMTEDAPIFEEIDLRGVSIGLIHTISEVGQG